MLVSDAIHICFSFIIAQQESLFNCESIVVAKELHKTKGSHYHVGILNDTAMTLHVVKSVEVHCSIACLHVVENLVLAFVCVRQCICDVDQDRFEQLQRPKKPDLKMCTVGLIHPVRS